MEFISTSINIKVTDSISRQTSSYLEVFICQWEVSPALIGVIFNQQSAFLLFWLLLIFEMIAKNKKNQKIGEGVVLGPQRGYLKKMKMDL